MDTTVNKECDSGVKQKQVGGNLSVCVLNLLL